MCVDAWSRQWNVNHQPANLVKEVPLQQLQWTLQCPGREPSDAMLWKSAGEQLHG
jgi:hypothetical protein